MKPPFLTALCASVLLLAFIHGNGQSALVASARVPAAAASGPGEDRPGATSSVIKTPAGKKHAGILTKYEQTCALRFFEFCDYLLAPPDIVIDSVSYSAGEKKEEILMQRERAEDTAKIKKAVLRYTVVPEPTNTADSLHFSQDELSDQDYRKLETAFAKLEKLLDTCYNMGGTPLKLVPFRLHDDAFIRSQLDPLKLSSTFLLRRGNETLAVLLFTPQNRMTSTAPPRICGWSVDFGHGHMIFHRIDGEVVPRTAGR